MNQPKDLYIILPVHNRISTTQKFIKFLIAQTFKQYILILIDDGSIDGTSSMVKDFLPKNSIIIKGDGSLWWAGSLHKAHLWVKKNLEISTYNILIINDDTDFNQSFLENGLKALDNKDSTLLQACSQNKKNPSIVDKGFFINWETNEYISASKELPANCFSTRGLLMTGKSFIDLGGFFPKILPHYGSDYQYTYRAYKKKFQLITDKNFILTSNEELTGIHSPGHKNLYQYLRDVLNKRCVINPFYQTSYIILTCPWRWKALNITRIWKQFIFSLIKALKS